MPKIKTPKDLSTSELLERLNDTYIGDLDPIIEYKNDLIDFIEVFNIKDGKHKVRSQLLYKLYKKWSKNPISPQTFGLNVIDFISHYFNGKYNVLLINKTPKNIALNIEKNRYRMHPMKVKSYRINFEGFIKHYNIKKGTFFLPALILHNLYDKYIYENNIKNSLIIKHFSQFCSLYFKCKISSHINWFGVDKSILNYFSEDLKDALKRKKGNYSAKKTNQKV